MANWSRRRMLGVIAYAATCVACRRERAAQAASSSWRELAFSPDTDVPDGQLAQVMIPSGEGEHPLLVALHGRGEASRGLSAGARGWRDDYHLEAMHRRLEGGALTRDDLGGMATSVRMARLNRSLHAASYRGLHVVCPYTPALADRTNDGARPFGRFITQQLLPRVQREAGGTTARDATGIDGVSMGGRLALWVGLSNPEVFGAVGALQPAISPAEVPAFAELAKKAQTHRTQHLRLVTSEEDPFRSAVEALSERLSASGVKHEAVLTPGPHDYSWNRGPGAAELLLWHERVLRGLPPP